MGEAIDSVASQSYADWELILTDDGSTDGSAIRCDDAASRYADRVRVIHQPNSGQASARNAALDIARGDQIFFMDSDDVLPQNAFFMLEEAFQTTNADIVCGKMIKFSSSLPQESTSWKIMQTYSGVEAVEDALYQRVLDNSVGGKLYSARIWKDLRFREGTYYEDLDIFYKAFLRANKIVNISAATYYYRQHSSSYIHTFNMRRSDMLHTTFRIREYMERHCPELVEAARSRQFSANFNMLMLLSANKNKIGASSETDAEKMAEECRSLIREMRKEILLNSKTPLKNRIGVLATLILGFPLTEQLGKCFYR